MYPAFVCLSRHDGIISNVSRFHLLFLQKHDSPKQFLNCTQLHNIWELEFFLEHISVLQRTVLLSQNTSFKTSNFACDKESSNWKKLSPKQNPFRTRFSLFWNFKSNRLINGCTSLVVCPPQSDFLQVWLQLHSTFIRKCTDVNNHFSSWKIHYFSEFFAN